MPKQETEKDTDPKQIQVVPGNIPILSIQLLSDINQNLGKILAELRHQRLENK
jgi:hypothetical protein